jgi:hypothetical protein
MDPYIERPVIWADVHDSLVAAIKALLQPQLKPKYVALIQDRLYVTEMQRPVQPDVAVVRSRTSRPESARPGGTATVVLAPDPATVFLVPREEVREPYIQIVEPAARRRVVTSIEVLSPKNKRGGAGRRDYVQKRGELWGGGANLVEIDLLRSGRSTTRLSEEQLSQLGRFHYVIAVSRAEPPRREAYQTTVRGRLPRVAVPLAAGDADVTLDLQAAFTRCWDEGAYPDLLRYEGPPPGPMSAEDVAWCEDVLRQKGMR